MSYIVDLSLRGCHGLWCKMADRTKRSEEKKQQKKEKRRVKEKRQKRQRRKRRKRRRRNWNRRRGPWLALSVDECLELPLGLHYLPVYRSGLILVWNLSLLPREPSIIQSLYCARNISGESLAGGIPAGGVGTLQTWNWDRQHPSCQSCRSCLPCHDFWCKFQRRKEYRERMRTLVRWWISQQDLHSPQKTCFAGPLVAGFQPHGKPTQFLQRGTSVFFWRWKIDGNTPGMAQLHRTWLQNDADVGSISRPGSRTASKWKSRWRMMAWSLEIEVKDDVHHSFDYISNFK